MDTKKLELLLETVNCGSMKRAAEKLNYTQSGLVYMLNSLEQELGFTLLNRTFRGVSLTPEGEQLKPYIQQIVENTRKLEDEISTLSAQKQQEIFIGVYPAIAKSWIPDVSRRFMELHSDVRIHIFIGMEELAQWLEDGNIDIAICEHGISGKNTWIPIFKDEVYVALPADKHFPSNQPVPLDDLVDYPVLLTSHNPNSTGNSDLVKWVNSRNRAQNLEVKAPDASVQLLMVGEGLGITFLSSLYRFECPLSVQMNSLDPPLFREVGCMMKSREQPTPLMKDFITFLKDYIKTEKVIT